ncbi:hypothetical protein QVD17_18787 [Tagetes erecta]|uniref:Reverse transcriptase domain-containing protein n=1 Tax=Tagetes erecta TaxID=13708 RepID=A0AAD8NWQ7_TARER|nr:hypothetical protein QVD17_18787 [Tagetes erecta]
MSQKQATWKMNGLGATIPCNNTVPDKKLAEKLKNIKASVKLWRNSAREASVKEEEDLGDLISELEILAEERPLTDDELTDRLNCKQKLAEIHNIKSMDLKQKSRCKWIKEGDENSSYFHRTINCNQSRKRINGMMSNGQWLTNPEDIKNHIVSFFELKFSEPLLDRPTLSSDGFKCLDPLTAHEIITPFSANEIKRAVWDCGGDKAPGPDSFTFKFFKRYWNIFELDFANIMSYFYSSCKINRGCNSSFITLIPKINDPQDMPDYRPINLIGAINKVVSKVLANRLKNVLPLVVSDSQSAYIEGRSILDGPLVVNEAMAWIKKMKMKALMLKVDLEKAFDSLSWSFLDMIMSHMQFPPLWRKWILGTLSNARSSILVNGSPTREFCIKRGVRQGDPLSPFLFILAMEALNVVMTKANSLGTFRGISIHHNGPTLSHLFFADDAIFMGEWSERNALNLTRILRCFYLASGLKVNYKKSRIFGLGVVENDVNNMAIVLNCQVGKLPFKYLGIPMGANMNHIKNWKDVIDIFESRLSSWKANALSFGGRITLLKSVLGSLPIYYFSLFKAPIHVIECLEKLRKKFLWSGNNPSAKIHWLKWDRIMAPKNMGGLGIGSLRAMNLALLGKWWWRAKSETNSLWYRVIKAIHYNNRMFFPLPLKPSISGTWKNIIAINKELLTFSIDLCSSIRGVVGKGNKLMFWSDIWIGNAPLGDQFPAIAKISSSSDITIEECYTLVNGTLIWNIPWKRNPQSHDELNQWNTCKLLLDSMNITNVSDEWRWDLNCDLSFTSGSLRRLIEQKRFTIYDGKFEDNKWLPIKVNFLHWRVVLNRLPTRQSLAHRGLQINDIVCPMCNAFVEDVDHIFAHCCIARQLWTQVGRWTRLPIAPSQPIDNIMDMNAYGLEKGSNRQKIVESIFKATIWCIWLARNECIFRGTIPLPMQILEDIKILSFQWVTNRTKLHGLDWMKWSSFSIVNDM